MSMFDSDIRGSQSHLIEPLGVKKPKCYFTTDISEELSCCSDGNFDSYGFPENICEQYPCEKFKKLCKDIRAAELAKASNELRVNWLATFENRKHPTNQKGNGSIQRGVSKSKLNEPLYDTCEKTQ